MVDGVLHGLVAKGDRRATNDAIGDAIGLTEKSVRELRAGAKQMLVGDLLAMGKLPTTRTAALAIIDTLRALIVEGASYTRIAPELRMLGVTRRTGDLADAVREALADGRIDGDEPQRIAAVALTLVSETQAIVRDVNAQAPALAKAGVRDETTALKLGIGRTAGGGR